MLERTTPPTARVTSVRGLRRHSLTDNLNGLDEDTLVEINIVGCMVSDEAILAQVSASANCLSGPAHAMALVPVSWYEGLPRMRELLDIPSDIRTLAATPQPNKHDTHKHKRPKIHELMRLEEGSGQEIAERWRRTTSSHLRLSEITRNWFEICEEQIPEDMAVGYLRARKLLANMFLRKTHRKAVAEFCENLSIALTQGAMN